MSHPSQQPVEVYHLSHDLRGPLNSILGFAELLLEGIEGPLNETQQEDIDAIYQSAQNLLILINNMVDISKLEADRIDFDFDRVNLNKAFQNILSLDFGTKKPEQLDLVVHQNEALPLLWGDSNRIEQMLLNLIRFAFNMKRMGEITVSAKSNAQTVTIQIGIAEVIFSAAELEDLFELVVYVDEAGRSELGRGGLELPLAQRLAERHQGRLWAESDTRFGTTLYVKLPTYEQVVDEPN